MSDDPKIKGILEFWFGTDPAHPLQNAKTWYQKDPAFDASVKRRFGKDVSLAARGGLDSWKAGAEGSLALIILLDQFSRNIYRDSAEAFANDPLALAASLEAQRQGFDRQLTPIQATFLYMPMMHAEDRALQTRSVETFRRLAASAPPELRDYLENSASFAERHAAIVERFGRFPHRNAVLGRAATAEESEFLKQPGSGF